MLLLEESRTHIEDEYAGYVLEFSPKLIMIYVRAEGKDHCIVRLTVNEKPFGGSYKIKLDSISRTWKRYLRDELEEAISNTPTDTQLRLINKFFSQVWESWSTGADPENDFELPDFSKELTTQLKPYGLQIAYGKQFLSESFWANDKNGKLRFYVLHSGLAEERGRGVKLKENKLKIFIEDYNKPKNFEYDDKTLKPNQYEEYQIRTQISLEEPKDLTAHAQGCYNTIYDSIEKYLWIQDETKKKFLTYWILGTYLYDVLDAYPILHVHGYYGSGKSRAGNFIGALSYHGQENNIDPTKADFFRTKEELRPTTIIDENETVTKIMKSQQDNILNSCYSRKGGYVSRRQETTIDGVRNYLQARFQLYSPTVLISINPVNSDALRSRVITLVMMKSNKNFPLAERTNFTKLQEDLFRFRIWGWKKIRDIYEEILEQTIEGFDPRDIELWLPTLTLMKFLGREEHDLEDVKTFAQEQIRFRKTEEYYDMLKEHVVYAMALHKNQILEAEKGGKKQSAFFREAIHEEGKIIGYNVTLKDLTRQLNIYRTALGFNLTKPIREKSVSQHLRKLNFSISGKTANKANLTLYCLNFDRLDYICKAYFGESVGEMSRKSSELIEEEMKK